MSAAVRGAGGAFSVNSWLTGATALTWVKKEPKLPGAIPTVNVFSGLNCDLPPFAYLFVYLDCATEL